MVSPDTFSIEIPNEPSSIDSVVAMADRFIECAQIDTKSGNRLQLCLDELITNVISYGFADGEHGTIRIDLGKDGENITVLVSDSGRPFNPFASKPTPSLDADLDEREIGGLGIFFVISTAKDHTYKRAGDRNIVRFRLDIGGD